MTMNMNFNMNMDMATGLVRVRAHVHIHAYVNVFLILPCFFKGKLSGTRTWTQTPALALTMTVPLTLTLKRIRTRTALTDNLQKKSVRRLDNLFKFKISVLLFSYLFKTKNKRCFDGSKHKGLCNWRRKFCPALPIIYVQLKLRFIIIELDTAKKHHINVYCFLQA